MCYGPGRRTGIAAAVVGGAVGERYRGDFPLGTFLIKLMHAGRVRRRRTLPPLAFSARQGEQSHGEHRYRKVDLYGSFSVKFFVAVPCLERKGRSSSRRLRSGSRSAREGVKGPKC